MHNRLMLDTVGILKSRMFQAWTSGWSVPTDEISISARLLSRHIEATDGIAEPWLRKVAQSAALKWRDEVCGVRYGEVQRAAIIKAGPPQQPSKAHRVVRVSARYCGQTQDGAFRFRHDVSDVRGAEIMRYVSQIHFNPPPDLPAYPVVHVADREAADALRQDGLTEKSGYLAAAAAAEIYVKAE